MRVQAVKSPKMTKAKLAELTKDIISTTATNQAKMKDNVRKVIASGQVDSFFALDLSDVNRRVELWRLLLPRVELFYAAKVNPSPGIIERCVSLNTGFDAAS